MRKGLVHPGQGRPKKGTKLVSYTEQAAASLGVSETTAKRDLARGKKIAPAVLDEVAGTALDRGVVLDQLAATPKSQQPAKLIAIREERAPKLAAPPVRAAEVVERQLAALMTAWNKAGPEARERFIARVGNSQLQIA